MQGDHLPDRLVDTVEHCLGPIHDPIRRAGLRESLRQALEAPAPRAPIDHPELPLEHHRVA